MGFGIDLRATPRKAKGLFRRGPDPKEMAERFGRLMPRSFKTWDRKTSQVALHPAAPPVHAALDDTELHVTGETWQVGPGYHADVLARFAPLLDELDLAWDAPALPALQQQMCEWLAGELRDGRTRLVERPYVVDGAAVLTMLGPRDAAWRDAVLADPMRAADAFAWWDKGDATRSRALLAMWHEVPWREPLDDRERDVLENFRRDADAAGLEIPDDAGYRRHDLRIDLSGGFRVRLGGAFVGKWEDDGARYWATDGDRAIEFESLTAHADAPSEQLLASAPEAHEVIARLAEGARAGRAEAYTDHDGVRIVVGLVCEAPHIAILTCKGGDDAWALATWRSLSRS